MADIPRVLATYDALVGVALGAGLTYGFGALNRRHLEKREDRTRWYETRLKAYAEFTQTVSDAALLTYPSTTSYAEKKESRERAAAELRRVVGTIRLVGSLEVVNQAERLFQVANQGMSDAFRGRPVDRELWGESLEKFGTAARKDLGHPSP
jgi:hypothetical protein